MRDRDYALKKQAYEKAYGKENKECDPEAKREHVIICKIVPVRVSGRCAHAIQSVDKCSDGAVQRHPQRNEHQ